MVANEATITGTVTASSGKIGGFTISGSNLYNGKSSLTANSNGVYIGTDGISLGKGSTFKVTKDGALTASNLTITGGSINLGSGVFSVSNAGVVNCSNITATGGTIGGCSITSGKLIIPAANITGKLTASHIDATDLYVSAAHITGTLSADHIDTALLRTNNLASAMANLTAARLVYLEVGGAGNGTGL